MLLKDILVVSIRSNIKNRELAFQTHHHISEHGLLMKYFFIDLPIKNINSALYHQDTQ